MLKNNNGITMVALVLTVIILAILSGVSLTTGFSVLKDFRAGRIISNMILVQAKLEDIYEDYEFYNDEKYLIGTNVNSINSTTYTLDDVVLSINEISEIATKHNTTSENVLTWKWYKWNQANLKELGLDKNMLGSNEYFYINYENSEIIYSTGTISDGNSYHSLTGLNNIIKN